MSEWRRVKLGEVCSRITSGGTPATKHEEYYGGDIPWLRTQEVDFKPIYDTEIKITDLGLANSSAKWIPANSVVVAMYGATAGRVAVAKIPITTNQACCNLIVDENRADYRFVYYALKHDFAELSGMAKGSAQTNLSAGIIRDYEIPGCSLPTQRRIADILSAYDDLIENNRRRIEILEETARMAYVKTAQLAENDTEVSLLDLFDYTRGVSYTSKEIEGEEGVLLVNLKNIQSWGGYRVGMEKHYSGLYKQDQTLQSGDVIMGVTDMTQDRRLVGHVALVPTLDGDVTFSADIIKLLPTKLSKVALYCLLRFSGVCERISKLATGATVLHLRPKELASIKLNMPNLEVLESLARQVASNFLQIDLLVRRNAKLAAARDLLLPQLMSGKLSVFAAEPLRRDEEVA